MSTLLYCPSCKTIRECMKRGKNSEGEQFYTCKTCQKRFPESLGTIPPPKSRGRKKAEAKAEAKTVKKRAEVKVEAKTVKKRAEAKSAKEKGSITEIYVNNNQIKKIEKIITVDEAFNLISAYFKEIIKDKVEITDNDNVRTIKFKIEAGTKG